MDREAKAQRAADPREEPRDPITHRRRYALIRIASAGYGALLRVVRAHVNQTKWHRRDEDLARIALELVETLINEGGADLITIGEREVERLDAEALAESRRLREAAAIAAAKLIPALPRRRKST